MWLLLLIPISILFLWPIKSKIPSQMIVAACFLYFALVAKESQSWLWVPRIIRFYGADFFICTGYLGFEYFRMRLLSWYGFVHYDEWDAKFRFFAIVIVVPITSSIFELSPWHEYFKAFAGGFDPWDIVAFVAGGVISLALLLTMDKKYFTFFEKPTESALETA